VWALDHHFKKTFKPNIKPPSYYLLKRPFLIQILGAFQGVYVLWSGGTLYLHKAHWGASCTYRLRNVGLKFNFSVLYFL
jgi:hypothetical protein